MTRAAKRDMDKTALRETWQLQARALGFASDAIQAGARQAEHDRSMPELSTHPGEAAGGAVRWAIEHLSERQTVFGHHDLLAAALGRDPGAVSVAAAERAIAALGHEGSLHAVRGLDHGRHWTTNAALGRESETIALMQAGQGVEKAIMRGWITETKLRNGRLNEGQKAAVKTILAAKDRVIGVQGYAGTGKTTMLKRFRVLAKRRGYQVAGLAPSASAANTLGKEAGIESETLQRFLARHAGLIEGRGTAKGLRNLRSRFAKTVLRRRRELARLQRTDARAAPRRNHAPPCPRRPGWRREAARRRRGREAVRAAPRRRDADRGHGRDRPAARRRAQGSGARLSRR